MEEELVNLDLISIQEIKLRETPAYKNFYARNVSSSWLRCNDVSNTKAPLLKE